MSFKKLLSLTCTCAVITFFSTYHADVLAWSSLTQPGNGIYKSAVQDPQEILITLKSQGFDPPEIRPQAGRFLLSIDNRSGVAELVLKLSRADGTQLKELRVSDVGGDWNEAFDLAPGTYRLVEATHSNWICVIIVPQNGQ